MLDLCRQQGVVSKWAGWLGSLEGGRKQCCEGTVRTPGAAFPGARELQGTKSVAQKDYSINVELGSAEPQKASNPVPNPVHSAIKSKVFPAEQLSARHCTSSLDPSKMASTQEINQTVLAFH